MGWASRLLLVALCLLALAEAQKQADAQSSSSSEKSSSGNNESSGGTETSTRKSSRSSRRRSGRRSSRKSDSSTEASPSSATESSSKRSSRSGRRRSSKSSSTEATSAETSTEASRKSSRRRSRKRGTTEAPSTETSTEASRRKSSRRNSRKGSTTEATPVETSTEASRRKSSHRRSRKGSTTEAPPPETSTSSHRRSSSRSSRRKSTTEATPAATTASSRRRCNRACRRRNKAARTTRAPTTTTTTTTTTTPRPTPEPMDAATVAALVSNNPALHVLNERVLLSAAYAYSDDNEVVCIFCLLQLLAAAHKFGNAQVRREIETSLQSVEPSRLGEALLQLVSGAPTLSGTFAGLYQRGAVQTCEAQPFWLRDSRCYDIEQFVYLRGTEVDFTRPDTTALINGMIQTATNDAIRDMFPPLVSSSQLVFASVLVFRDTWRQQLHWQPGSFTTFYGNLSAETLVMQDYMPLLDGSADGVIGVSLPYQQPGIRLMLFTTADGSNVVERLRTVHYRALASATYTYTTVFFPRFSINSNKYSYADMAQQMGVSEMFRRGLGIDGRLRMELFVQKAVMSVDVDGSDSLQPAPEPMWHGTDHPLPVQVVFDRPFACSIVHSELDVPLFTAIVRDPTRFY